MPNDPLNLTFGQHYQEVLPEGNVIAKESHLKGDDTLARVEKMKFEAMLKGRLLTFHMQQDEGYEQHFSFEEAPLKQGVPKLKLKDIVAQNDMKRAARLEEKNG